ncbi:hypothetical protein Q3G72_028791 [Acer saccharum]|nr:hypothetical protein Q3G72_028791 [Acer saccharum]
MISIGRDEIEKKRKMRSIVFDDPPLEFSGLFDDDRREKWQEVDDIDDCNMECANDIVKYTTKVNSQHVYSFLVGIDPQLNGVRGRVLATKPLPNIQANYAMVCEEANCQDAMLGGKIGEGVVMASQKTPTSKKDRKCTHHNGIGYTVDACY